MAKTWEEYKKYYLENNGYNSSHIENLKLTKKKYRGYLNSRYLTDEDIDDTLAKTDVDTPAADDLIARIETQNFSTAVDALFDNDGLPITIKLMEKYNGYITKGFDNKKWGSRFNGLLINGSGKVRTSHLRKGDVIFMDKKKVWDDLVLIDERINKILSSDKFSLEQKFNEILLYHLNFELIHPFGEGNGRTGRLLMDQMLFYIGLPSLNYKQDDDGENYLGIVGDAQYQMEKRRYVDTLYLSVPYEFKKYSWEKLEKQSKEMKELKFDSLFNNIDKINTRVVLDEIDNNKKEMISDFWYMQLTKKQSYLRDSLEEAKEGDEANES